MASPTAAAVLTLNGEVVALEERVSTGRWRISHTTASASVADGASVLLRAARGGVFLVAMAAYFLMFFGRRSN